MPGHFSASIFGHFWILFFSVYLPLEFEFRGKSGVGKRAMAAENLFHVMPPTFRLVYFIEWRVTLSKLL